MLPFINTPFGDISTFTISVACGIFVMLMMIHFKLLKSQKPEDEEMFIFPKVVLAAFVGLMLAAVADSLFKIRENSGFVIKGITFYGGLLGATATMYILLRFSKQKTEYSIQQWFNLLTLPLIAFHIFGRIGCFLSGCCYGSVTDSFLGVAFKDNADLNIFHNGLSRHPTQLYEAFALLMICLIVRKTKNKFSVYMLLYAICRFFIEFLRADNRGYVSEIVSPSQLIAICVFIVMCVYSLVVKKRKRTTLQTTKQ